MGITEWIQRQQRGSHASCGQCSPPMTRLNQQVHVTPQETLLHVDIFTAVGQQEGLPVTCRRSTFSFNTNEYIVEAYRKGDLILSTNYVNPIILVKL